jgi:DNA-directed RNA polymerase subunit RPC12/RpoP
VREISDVQFASARDPKPYKCGTCGNRFDDGDGDTDSEECSGCADNRMMRARASYGRGPGNWQQGETKTEFFRRSPMV